MNLAAAPGIVPGFLCDLVGTVPGFLCELALVGTPLTRLCLLFLWIVVWGGGIQSVFRLCVL